MTFYGPAEEDIKKIREEFPRDFTHPQVMDKLGWDKAKARQEYRQAKESDPSTTNFFDDWFRAWNKTHPHPLKPKKEKFINNHLMNMKWEDD